MISDSPDVWAVSWTVTAVENPTEIAEYIEKDSKYYATLVVKKIFESAESLSVFPLRGRVVPETRRDDIRELIYQPYRIIYKVGHKEIAIISIVHSRKEKVELPRKETWQID